MRYCVICHKKAVPGNGPFFNAPRDPNLRAKWDELCKKKFNTSTRICMDHFAKDDVITAGNRYMLMPKAMPIFPIEDEESPAPTSYTENSVSSNPKESDEFVLPDSSVQGLRYFTYDELTKSAAPKSEIQVQRLESQTDPPSRDIASTEYREKIRLLQAANKNLRCQLRQSNLAIKAMKKIFTDEQIRSLMRTRNAKWGWKDISSAAYLHASGPKAYNRLYKKGLPLPDVTTLQRWYCLKKHQRLLNRSPNADI